MPIKQFFRVTALWVLMISPGLRFVGMASNKLVLIANHDKMPVMTNPLKLMNNGGADPDGMMDDIHCVMTKDTHLNALADIWDLHTETDSIGDLVATLGEWSEQLLQGVWVALVCIKLLKQS